MSRTHLNQKGNIADYQLHHYYDQHGQPGHVWIRRERFAYAKLVCAPVARGGTLLVSSPRTIHGILGDLSLVQ